MALPITNVYLNINPRTGGAAVLSAGGVATQGFSPLATLGDKSIYRFWFYDVEQGATTGTTVRLNTLTLTLAGRQVPAYAAYPYVVVDDGFTEGGDGSGGWYYETTLDWNNEEIVTAFGDNNSNLSVLTDFQAEDVSGNRYTVQFTFDVRHQVISGTPSTTPDIPYATEAFVTTAVAEAFTTEDVANSTGNTTITIPAGSHHHTVQATITGSAGTRIFILATTNADAGAVISIAYLLSTTPSIVIESRNATSGGTLLDTITTDSSGDDATVDFYYTGSAWRLLGAVYPSN